VARGPPHSSSPGHGGPDDGEERCWNSFPRPQPWCHVPGFAPIKAHFTRTETWPAEASLTRLNPNRSGTDAVTSVPLLHQLSRLVASERISALSKTSTRLARNKVWVIPIIRLGLTRLEQRLFADLDAQAQHDGWQITRLRGGLARRYRDPRFSLLSACPDCAGGGSTDGQSCEPCRGTGRVTRARPCSPAPGGIGHA
jgi:hypothetical protein